VRLTRSFAAVCALCAVQFVDGAAPVVESQGTRATPAATPARPVSTPATSGVRSYGVEQNEVAVSEVKQPPPSASVGSGTTASSMFQQLQQVQDDVAELRGIVEQQTHQIEKLQAEQKEQYLDIDRRLSALRGQGEAAGGGPTTPSSGGGPTGGPQTSGPPMSGGPEQDAYTAAYNSAKANRYDEAIAAFNQQLVMYPNGKFAGNAYYWLGELYLKLPQPALEKSRQSFAQVVNQYKDNAHVSEAMFKLGVVYDRLGDRAKSMEYLNRVQSQFPGTPGAKLAQTYAAELR
jgi:tol-pal system protein YbgF